MRSSPPAGIPSSFEALSVFDVLQTTTGFGLVERTISAPYRKNYDQFEDPLAWPRNFETERWVLISAFVGHERVGGLVTAVATPGFDMLEGRTDLAVVWDLRVAPVHRRRSVATSLLCRAQDWARRMGYRELQVETQNTNPPACKFYMHNGFVLAEVRPGAYAELPEDVQLIWRKKLKPCFGP